jgi:DNA-binding CsgD family transcriptional regulator
MVAVDADGAPRCVLHVAPLGTPAAGVLPLVRGRAIVFAYELTAIAVSVATLMSLFGVTAAEARAALEVPRGGSLAAMADRLDVSVNTLKTQLQAVYAKTMTRRQADLLKVLLALSKR